MSSDHERFLYRVTQISLTCKSWETIEREHPHRPEQLRIVPENLNASFMTWHLRDTSRLREVQILGDESQAAAGKSCWEWMSRLLTHLSVSTPALRTLEILPPNEDWEGQSQMGNFLPLIGALGQLEALVLREWRSSRADIDIITHLTRLQNLKVAVPGGFTDCP